jgi:hypothetical protein
MSGALRRLAELIVRNLQREPEEKLFYRGVKPVSAEDMSSAVRKQRPNSLEGSEWWTDNPLLAEAYGPAVIAARLNRAPDVILSASGRTWDDYFLMPSPTGPGYSVRAGLRPGPFREAFQSPSRDILVRNIHDAGPYVWPRQQELGELLSEYGYSPAYGNNLLVKRGSDLLRRQPPQLKARGGLAQLKEHRRHG